MLVKKIRIISLFLIFFSLFISCENSIPYNEEENQSNFEAEEIKSAETVYYGNIYGSYQNYGGALPATLQKSIAKADYNKLDFQNRSAIPALGSELNQIEYYVIARAEGEEPVSGSVSEEDKTFSISGLKFGIDWDIEVGINVKQIDENGNISWLRCFYDTTENVKLSKTELSITRNLILKPDTSGYGSVDLDLTADTNITGLEIKLDDTEQKAKWQAALAADADKEISASKIKLANLPAGQYNLILLFKRNGESYSCYSTPQTINVINGMTTDTWQSDGTSLISTTGEFNLTSTIISNYVDSCIYVGPNSASDSIGVIPDNSNEGRAYSPLASVNEAIKRIRSANVRRDYKIFVSGDHEENIKIGGEGADVLPGTAAASITIQGLNNNNAADVLMSPQLSTAPCLSIQTDIPVIFKNIKITTDSNSFLNEYNASAQGGGLYIKTGTASPGVTLDAGALIDNCIISGTEAKGAGIYLDSGKLTIKNGAKISNNHFPDSNGFGGGIYIKSGAELILSGSFDIPYGGSVTQNDIYVEAAESIKIKNAISPQAGTSGAMATITPAQDLQRGVSIVSLASGSSLSSIVSYKDYFDLSNNDWFLKANSAGNALIIDAPIYVAGSANTLKVCAAAGSTSGNGTKSAPFATIEQAVNAIIGLNAAEDYTIYVDGEILGHQTIPSTLTSGKASSLTIQGASGNTNDILNGNNTNGSVLTISSTVPVTIKDLKITGGKNADGAGIKAEAEGAGAYLVLDQGTLITENDAGSASGGGVSIRGGTLIMKGNAEISECYGTWGGGIRAQDADASAIGTMVMLVGNASIKDCTGSEGGGIGLIGSRVLLYVRDNAEISGNTANTDGGGIRLFGSTANISGGLIKENKAVSAGGAVSVKNDGVLNLSGTAWIPEGVTDSNGILQKGVCLNDIYLKGSCNVTIAGALNPPAAANEKVAVITPDNKVRGLALIEADNTHVTDLTSYKDYFALTNANDGWNFKLSSDNKALKLDAPIYVAGQTSHPLTGKAGKAPADGGTGEKSKPFDTIANACSLLADSTWNYEILVDGQIIGLQSIPSSLTSSHASGITIQGATGNTSDILNGNGASGTVLTISSPVPVTIKDLKITGANNSGFGGGINMMSGSNVTLESGALIGGTSGSTAASGTDNSNKAARGAGIYSAGNLKLKNGSSVTYNYADGVGGGIYCDGGSLSINDCAVISLNGAGTSGGVYTTNDVTISGPVIIAGNVNYTGNPSNLYLTTRTIRINVAGSLTDGDKNAQIGISNGAILNPGDSIVFTSNYGTFNSGTAPGTYFTGDTYNVTLIDGEAALGSNVEVINTENIETLILTAGNNYNFVLSSDCTLSTMETLISKIKNSSIRNSKIDLSNTSITNISTASWIPAKITSVTLPSTFNHVGSQDFQDANDLEEINISDDNQYFKVIDGVLYDKALTTVVKYPAAKTGEILNLPDTVTTIKMQAFKNNKNLVTINGLDRITSIRSDSGHTIFYYSQKLEEVDFSSVTDDQLPYCTFDTSSVIKVTLSPSITKIGTRNFIYCTRLTEVHLKTSEPPVLCANEIGTISNEKIFTNNNTNLKIYVPAGSKAAYLADTDREGGFANPSYNGLASRADFSDLIIEE